MAKHVLAEKHAARAAFSILLMSSLGFGLGACNRASTAAAPGMTWESIKTAPDLGGWWEWQYTEAYQPPGPDGKPRGLPQIMIKAPFKPEVIGVLIETLSKVDDASNNRKELFGANNACLPPYFFGVNGGPFHQFEILFTPGRATIADEMGLVRRVNLGQALPTDLEESNTGTSVGRWEDGTLVIETTGIDHRRTFFVGPFKIGKGIHVVERLRLKEPDLLEIAVEMTAPELFAGTFKDTLFYKRNRDHTFTDQGSCSESDRSIDHKAGKEQLDLTPPEDLPPPPAD